MAVRAYGIVQVCRTGSRPRHSSMNPRTGNSLDCAASAFCSGQFRSFLERLPENVQMFSSGLLPRGIYGKRSSGFNPSCAATKRETGSGITSPAFGNRPGYRKAQSRSAKPIRFSGRRRLRMCSMSASSSVSCRSSVASSAGRSNNAAGCRAVGTARRDIGSFFLYEIEPLKVNKSRPSACHVFFNVSIRRSQKPCIYMRPNGRSRICPCRFSRTIPGRVAEKA